MSFAGKTVLGTGSTSGIGRAAAETFGREALR
jgi:NAD(P)-dependent dehydrogenase (short-subunit alcohol dehydrogenase family)